MMCKEYTEEEFDELLEDDNTVYRLTPYGIFTVLCKDYHIDISNMNPTLGNHFCDDFMEMMCKNGYVKRSEEEIDVIETESQCNNQTGG